MGWQPTWAKRPGREAVTESPQLLVADHGPRGHLVRTSWGTVCVSDLAGPSIELFGPSPNPAPIVFPAAEKPAAAANPTPRPQRQQSSLFPEQPRKQVCKRPPRKAVA